MMNGFGEYQMMNGFGEYLMMNGFGEYQMMNGFGEYLMMNGFWLSEDVSSYLLGLCDFMFLCHGCIFNVINVYFAHQLILFLHLISHLLFP